MGRWADHCQDDDAPDASITGHPRVVERPRADPAIRSPTMSHVRAGSKRCASVLVRTSPLRNNTGRPCDVGDATTVRSVIAVSSSYAGRPTVGGRTSVFWAVSRSGVRSVSRLSRPVSWFQAPDRLTCGNVERDSNGRTLRPHNGQWMTKGEDGATGWPMTPSVRSRPAGPRPGAVEDFSRILAGPYATMLLAISGDCVLKVEDRKAMTRVPGCRR